MRSFLNREACDIRQLAATIMSVFADDEPTRRKLLNSLRKYISRIIVESRAGNVAEVRTSESELDGILQTVYDRRRRGPSR